MLLIVCLSAPIAAQEVLLPANMKVDAQLADTVADMLRCSTTFREQCRLLARLPHVSVRFALDPNGRRRDVTSRALCELRKYEFGRIEASVRLWSIAEAPELIAHELEHVLEYAEGLNYQAEAFSSNRVWLGKHGSYESTRAILAGLRVAEQMSRTRAARVVR